VTQNRSSSRLTGIFIPLVLALLAVFCGDPARATGVAGDRLFPSTLLVEDTQNDDELELPTGSWLRRSVNSEAPAARQLGAAGQMSRLLTPDLAVSIGAGWRRLDLPASGRAQGWENLDLGLKYRAFVSEPHEVLVSTGLFAEIGGTGTRRIDAERFSTVQPVVSFGKGWGDLPRQLDWLRPAAITGAAAIAVPTGAAAATARYGLSLQYSLYYLDRHTGIPVEPWLGRWIPLVEFSGETPLGRSYNTRTTAIAAPGIVWMGEEMQLAVEALVPLNRHTGRGIGVIAQAHFFLDEMMPGVFAEPSFARE
jgi:hypothetical protein